MTIGLIDADAACYTAVASAGQELDFGDGDPIFDWEACKRHCLRDFDYWTKRLALDDIVLCWSDRDRHSNWRLGVLPTYKFNRTGDKPEGYWELRDWLEANYESVTLPGLEGDDVLGIMQTGPYGVRYDTIIIAVDKDMATIPGKWFRPAHSGKIPENFQYITPDVAHWYHMYQTIMGDSTDGYTGCPQAGPKAAESWLGAPGGNLWPYVVGAYEEQGWTEEDAAVQAMVARILHRRDWDSEKQEPILWTPDL